MQFFYLLSFVTVASYAAALPQPEGLSEQYSNNVDTNLASILKARSYQPVLDTREDSPTLMSLERRAGSAGSSEGRTVFGTQPLSTLGYEEAGKLIDSVFKQGDLSFANIASTIKKVGDGIAKLSENGEKVKTKIVGPAGEMLARYLSRSTYVNLALTLSASRGLNTTISFIRSTTTPAEFPNVFLAFIGTFMESMTGADKKERESDGFIVNILKDTGVVVQNVEEAIRAVVEALDILIKFFDAIKTLMSKSEKGKTIHDDISNMMKFLPSLLRNKEDFIMKL
ncbi:hypothetical protein BASA60_001102 [Batrachochytrium salamandrivorans]|nr:hypothetical protein BASA60_001102 [Batrachochytrium salamandrivorans]